MRSGFKDLRQVARCPFAQWLIGLEGTDVPALSQHVAHLAFVPVETTSKGNASLAGNTTVSCTQRR